MSIYAVYAVSIYALTANLMVKIDRSVDTRVSLPKAE